MSEQSELENAEAFGCFGVVVAAVGLLFVAVTTGCKFGSEYGCLVFGLGVLAFGVWIVVDADATVRRIKRQGGK